VIGKHLYIDYAVSLDPGGRIRQVDILQYRESYGGEIRSASWLAQFVGKTNASALQVGNDIRNISGATLSSHHVTEGIKRIMSIANRLR
jgi:Na+-translocating ferredoxin:NAD+ oxidoreductase RnfG subunit